MLAIENEFSIYMRTIMTESERSAYHERSIKKLAIKRTIKQTSEETSK